MSLPRFALLLLCLALAGCHPGSQGTVDEQKEPYFLAAKKRVQERDYQGAIDYFEKALDVNPRSSAAHIELGVLYEQQRSDWPSALYHYTRALILRPDYSAADVINQRIEYCKRELAKSVVQLPSVEALQHRLDVATAENQQLRQMLQAWQNYYAAHGALAPSNPPSASQRTGEAPADPKATGTAMGAQPELRPTASNAPTRVAPPERPREAVSATRSSTGGSTRTHTVAAGETLDKIAKRYNVRLSTLQSANPTVDARRLRLGQTIIIPSGSP